MATSGKVRPSRAWFILPSVLFLVGVLLAGIAISSFAQFVRSDFRAYTENSSISVTRDGFTLYAQDGTVSAPSDLRCVATGPEAPVPLQPVSGRSVLNNGRGTFVAIASTPTDLPAGRYVISCESASGAPAVPVYLGPRLDLGAVGRLAIFGIVAPLFLGLSSVLLFAVLAFLRYRSHRTTSAAA